MNSKDELMSLGSSSCSLSSTTKYSGIIDCADTAVTVNCGADKCDYW